MKIRKWKPVLADNLERPLKYILPGLLAMMYAGVVVIDKGSESVSLEEGMSVLDVACGPGYGAGAAADRFWAGAGFVSSK